MRIWFLLVFFLIAGMAHSQAQSINSESPKNTYSSAYSAQVLPDTLSAGKLQYTIMLANYKANHSDYSVVVAKTATLGILTAGIYPLVKLGDVSGDIPSDIPTGVDPKLYKWIYYETSRVDKIQATYRGILTIEIIGLAVTSAILLSNASF